MEEIELKSECGNFKKRIKIISDDVEALMNYSTFNDEMDYPGQHSEIKANIMFAYRHLEDAGMRIDKIIEAIDYKDLK